MADPKKASAKSKVEAVLFSVGHKITIDEICRLCRSRKEEVLESLQELRAEYDSKQSSLMLFEEGDSWKFAVRDHLISVVRKIVTETELSRSVMETLAVIAFKYPILQADLIKMRTNKAYDHLAELEKSGYITRQKHGRTNLIKLTEKFFRYFDLTEEKLKDQFKDFDSIARAIKEKEEEVDKIKEDQVKRAQDLKQEDEKIRSEIESLDKADEEFSIPVQAYNAKQEESKTEVQEETNDNETKELIGDLEVVNVDKETKKTREEPEEEQGVEIKKEENADAGKTLIQNNEIPKLENISQTNNELKKHIDKQSGPSQKKKKLEHHGIKLPPEAEAKVNERVNEMMHGEENKEDSKEENQNQ
ncbi:MAG: SMC-Scp complex subunit ScpB [Nanoarchaeota archaeon]